MIKMCVWNADELTAVNRNRRRLAKSSRLSLLGGWRQECETLRRTDSETIR